MLVKDVIILACEFTENNELAKSLSNNNLDEDQSLIVDSLVKCFNLVNNEICSEYMPLIKQEKVQMQDFKCQYSQLSNKVLDIISVVDRRGNKVKFKCFDNYFIAFANEVYVKYTYVSQDSHLEDEIFTTIPERVYAYGVAREFYFMQTLFDEADVWEERFKNSLSILTRKKNEIIMPRRRWI